MYIIPKNGATVTIFAPYDCKNNCSFCINKKEYQTNPDFNMNKVLKSMEVMNKLTPYCDFVITGGEPLASLPMLERILMSIELMNLQGARHKVFINTTLPVQKKDIYTLNRWKSVITGINISRHIKDYIIESNDILLSYLKIPIRINCILCDEEEASYAHEIVERFPNIPIQFRDDYRNVNYDNLYNMLSNKILHTLIKTFNTTLEACSFQYNSFKWDCIIQPNIKFHRTMRNSKLDRADDVEINDVIITTHGNILDDWNEHGEVLNLIQYQKGLNYK